MNHPHLRPLTSEIALHTAAMERRIVLVYLDGELIGAGWIDEITPEAIRINGEWYMRNICRFFAE